jgi:hypothetical protein
LFEGWLDTVQAQDVVDLAARFRELDVVVGAAPQERRGQRLFLGGDAPHPDKIRQVGAGRVLLRT